MINEEEARQKNPPVVELDVPHGESLVGYFERYFGTRASSDNEMPEEADVDSTIIIKLK